uniref:Uncharacterized protein n=1 Tax=Plectus sambesii TaxID=2011161 RepID=A0A914XPQ1_9BILA
MGYEEACVYSTRFVMHGRMALKTEWEEEGIERRWGDVVRRAPRSPKAEGGPASLASQPPHASHWSHFSVVRPAMGGVDDDQ